MAVGLIDNDEAEVLSGTSGTTPSTTVSGSNTCAAVGVRLSDLSSPTTVKWGGSGGTAMTQVTSPVTVDWWRLVAPSTGAGYASWSGNKAAHIVSQTMDTVDQSSPIQDSDTGTAHGDSSNGVDITAAASVTLTTTSGSAVLGNAKLGLLSAGSLSSVSLSVSGALTERQTYGAAFSFGNAVASGSSTTAGFTGYGTVTYDDGSYIDVDADFVVFKEATGGGATNITTNNLSIATSLSAPTITQAHSVSPNNLAVAPSLSAPAITQAHVVSPANLSVAPSLAQPAIAQTYVITPDGLLVALSLSQPSIAQAHIISPNALAIAIVLSQPSLTQAHAVSPAALSIQPALNQPSVSAQGDISVDPLAAAVSLSQPAVAQIHIVAPNALAVASALSQPSIASGIAISAGDLAVLLGLSSPALAQLHIIQPNNLSVLDLLSMPIITGAGIIIPVPLGRIYPIGSEARYHAIEAEDVFFPITGPH